MSVVARRGTWAHLGQEDARSLVHLVERTRVVQWTHAASGYVCDATVSTESVEGG